MAKEIVIAHDSEERTTDKIAFGPLPAESIGAPARLVLREQNLLTARGTRLDIA